MSTGAPWALQPVLLAGAGVLVALPLWRWLRDGGYRRSDDVAALDLRRSWVILPAAGAGAAVVASGALQGALLVAGLVYAVTGAVLAWIDVDVHRVPDQVLRWLAGALVVCVLAAAVLERSWEPVVGAVFGAAGLGVLYLLLALVASMGLGDVKLAAVTGLLLGAVGLGEVLQATVLAFLAAGAVAVALVLTRRAGRGSYLPFAPAVVVGALAAVL